MKQRERERERWKKRFSPSDVKEFGGTFLSRLFTEF